MKNLFMSLIALNLALGVVTTTWEVGIRTADASTKTWDVGIRTVDASTKTWEVGI